MTTTETGPLVTIEDIRAAAELLRGVTIETPLVAYGRPEERRYLKAESLQPIGAFKLRGAYAAIASLPAEALAHGVISYSSGNHAQGVARAARLLGVPAVIVMPSDAPTIKRDRVAADGAQIVTVGTSSDERQEGAEQISTQRGLAIIPPDAAAPRPRHPPAVRRRPDHRRPGNRRARDRRRHDGRGCCARPDRWWRPCERC